MYLVHVCLCLNSGILGTNDAFQSQPHVCSHSTSASRGHQNIITLPFQDAHGQTSNTDNSPLHHLNTFTKHDRRVSNPTRTTHNPPHGLRHLGNRSSLCQAHSYLSDPIDISPAITTTPHPLASHNSSLKLTMALLPSALSRDRNSSPPKRLHKGITTCHPRSRRADVDV